MKNPIIVLTGPTGSGKTSISLKLAKKFSGVIINGDSVAIYKGMDIGTAKPTKQEIKAVSHYLFDIRNPDKEYNAAMYVSDVKNVLTKIPAEKPVFIVGGSMLYIDAFAYNYDFSKKGRSKLKLPKNILYLALDVPRTKLYRNINQRFDEMMKNELLKEVKKLYKKYGTVSSLNSAGYKQLIQYLEGNLDLDQAIEKAKQAHRNYAKRQLTWFRHNKDIIWITGEKEAEREIKNFLS